MLTLSPSILSPLPYYWPNGRYRGYAIHCAPTAYLVWRRRGNLSPGLRAAVIAELGLRQLAFDHQEDY